MSEKNSCQLFRTIQILGAHRNINIKYATSCGRSLAFRMCSIPCTIFLDLAFASPITTKRRLDDLKQRYRKRWSNVHVYYGMQNAYFRISAVDRDLASRCSNAGNASLVNRFLAFCSWSEILHTKTSIWLLNMYTLPLKEGEFRRESFQSQRQECALHFPVKNEFPVYQGEISHLSMC